MAVHWEFKLEVEFGTKKDANLFEKQVKDVISSGKDFEFKSAGWSFTIPDAGVELDECINVSEKTFHCFGACFTPFTAENVETAFSEMMKKGAKKINIYFYNIDNDKSPKLFVSPIPKTLYGPIGFDEYEPSDVLVLSVEDDTVQNFSDDDPSCFYETLEADMKNVLNGEDPGYPILYTLISDNEVMDEDVLMFEE